MKCGKKEYHMRVERNLKKFMALAGFAAGLSVVYQKFLHPAVPVGYTSLLAALLFIGGMIMLLLGLIGEYIGRIYISINQSPQYVIREIV